MHLQLKEGSRSSLFFFVFPLIFGDVVLPRMAAIKGGTAADKCSQCTASLIRQPFERLIYKYHPHVLLFVLMFCCCRYCSVACLQTHKVKLDKDAEAEAKTQAAKGPKAVVIQ